MTLNPINAFRRWRLRGKLDFLRGVGAILQRINLLETNMSGELQRLRDEVAQNTTITESAVALIGGISQQLRDAIANGASADELNALADSLDADQQKLAAAIAENTGGPAETPADPPTDAPEAGG